VTVSFICDPLYAEEVGLMHSITGRFFANPKGLVMHQGDRVRWYIMGMENGVGLRGPHWRCKAVT
jgi:hypothetical protein